MNIHSFLHSHRSYSWVLLRIVRKSCLSSSMQLLNFAYALDSYWWVDARSIMHEPRSSSIVLICLISIKFLLFSKVLCKLWQIQQKYADFYFKFRLQKLALRSVSRDLQYPSFWSRWRNLGTQTRMSSASAKLLGALRLKTQSLKVETTHMGAFKGDQAGTVPVMPLEVSINAIPSASSVNRNKASCSQARNDQISQQLIKLQSINLKILIQWLKEVSQFWSQQSPHQQALTESCSSSLRMSPLV